MRTSFGGRVMATLVGMIVAGQGVTALVVSDSARRSALDNARMEMRVAGEVFERFAAGRGERLATAVRVLAADFAFRDAVGTGDGPTVASALDNHGGRVGATLSLLVRPDATVLAAHGTSALAAAGVVPSLAPLIAASRPDAPSFGTLNVGGTSYQVVVVPVTTPQPMGWLVMGFGFDEAFASDFKDIATVDVTLIAGQGAGQAVAASTLPPAGAQAAFRDLPQLDVPEARELGGQRYFSHVHDAGNGLVAVLHREEGTALAAANALSRRLLVLSLAVLVVCALLAMALARGVTQPVRRLVEAARRIGVGFYDQTVRVDRNDEIGELASTLDGMRRSISEREARITHQASHDALTGLPNRVMVGQRLRQAIATADESGTAFCVLLTDLDRFKEINDTLGHATGDAVLEHVAQRLRGVVSPTDTIARLGGDEFMLVVEPATLADGESLARKLVAAIGRPLQLPEMQLHLAASVGVVVYPDHGRTAEELLRRADIAMYAAKEERLTVSIYRAGQDEGHLRKLALVNDLRLAIGEDQLSCVYQPKGDVASGHVAEAEALVRWTHPTYGPMSPAEFIPLAEQSGQVRPLTQWMLRHVVRQLRTWLDHGVRMSVAVNLSALDLMDAALPQRIAGLLAEYEVPPVHLSLEITESAVMRDTAYAVRVLEELKAAGIGLAIDDFGTGYSSLSQLQKLPVNELKIDRSFIMPLDSPGADPTIVRSTIELAHNMGLKVVAEGVETQHCLEVLRELGCDKVQGYFLSRPLAADALTAWLAARSAPPGATPGKVLTLRRGQSGHAAPVVLAGLAALGTAVALALAPPAANAAGGKLLGTGGAMQLEGSGGGGLVPWAFTAGYGTEGQWGGGVGSTWVDTQDYRLAVLGGVLTWSDRLELSAARQEFRLGTLAGALGLSSRTDLRLNVFGAKFRVLGNAVYGPWPQVAVGAQYKQNLDFAIPSAVGARDSRDLEPYVAVGKLWLAGVGGYHGWANATVRYTRANQAGLLGFGGDRGRGRGPVLEVSAATFLNPYLALGAEYRQKPDGLGFAREEDWKDVFVGWFPNKRVSVVVAYTWLGDIAALPDQRGAYVSVQWTQ